MICPTCNACKHNSVLHCGINYSQCKKVNYRQQYRLLEKKGSIQYNWILLSPRSQSGNPERLEKHFKAVPHGNGQFKIVNAAGNQILEMKINQNVWKVSSMNPMSPMQIQNLFSFKEVDEGSGKASWCLDVSSIF